MRMSTVWTSALFVITSLALPPASAAAVHTANCTGGQEFYNCVPPCARTCAAPRPTCPPYCQPGCRCPPSHPIWQPRVQRCIFLYECNLFTTDATTDADSQTSAAGDLETTTAPENSNSSGIQVSPSPPVLTTKVDSTPNNTSPAAARTTDEARTTSSSSPTQHHHLTITSSTPTPTTQQTSTAAFTAPTAATEAPAFTSCDAGQNCVNGVCYVSGVCVHGCETGYHGASCSSACSATCISRLCGRFNAACLAGCPEGRHGVFCEERCSTHNVLCDDCPECDGRCQGVGCVRENKASATAEGCARMVVMVLWMCMLL